jgi:hypothetical protein
MEGHGEWDVAEAEEKGNGGKRRAILPNDISSKLLGALLDAEDLYCGSTHYDK